MERKKKHGLTMEEILQHLHEEDEENIDHADVIIIPPDVDDLTDEDEACDDLTGEVTVQDVPGSLELHIETKSSTAQDSTSNNSVGVHKSSTSKKRKLCKSQPNWRYKEPQYNKVKQRGKTHEDNLQKMKEEMDHLTPLELFESIMSPNIYDHIVKETVRYATACKNKGDFVFTVEELKCFIGILLFSSYHKLPAQRHYWSKDEDLGVSLVKKAMSRNKFQITKGVVHFCDNAEAESNKLDKGFKVRNLITLLQESFIKFGVFEPCISVDEMMVKYYGHHSLKQFIQVKPVRFGYKLWALCGTSGYCYNFDLYCGKNSEFDGNDDLLLGSKVVLRMLQAVANPESHSLFIDNFFTNYDLLVHLRNLGYQVTGTLRENRLKQCPLEASSDMKKKKKQEVYMTTGST